MRFALLTERGPPVILLATTSFSRRPGPALHQRPMSSSQSPSRLFGPDGIGYCSAVSTRFTPPPSTARSSSAAHAASSGALKSADAQRCVPSATSLTTMSPPPSRLRRIPFTVSTTSPVGRGFAPSPGAAPARAAPPPKSPPSSPPPTPRLPVMAPRRAAHDFGPRTESVGVSVNDHAEPPSRSAATQKRAAMGTKLMCTRAERVARIRSFETVRRFETPFDVVVAELRGVGIRSVERGRHQRRMVAPTLPRSVL